MSSLDLCTTPNDLSGESKEKEIQIIFPRDKLNDMNFINEKLLEVTLDTLFQISQHSDSQFVDLVKQFTPDLSSIKDDSFLSRWNLNKSILESSPISKTTEKVKKKVVLKRH